MCVCPTLCLTFYLFQFYVPNSALSPRTSLPHVDSDQLKHVQRLTFGSRALHERWVTEAHGFNPQIHKNVIVASPSSLLNALYTAGRLSQGAWPKVDFRGSNCSVYAEMLKCASYPHIWGKKKKRLSCKSHYSVHQKWERKDDGNVVQLLKCYSAERRKVRERKSIQRKKERKNKNVNARKNKI